MMRRIPQNDEDDLDPWEHEFDDVEEYKELDFNASAERTPYGEATADIEQVVGDAVDDIILSEEVTEEKKQQALDDAQVILVFLNGEL